jgi:predicted outer membrane repeat protein
MKVTTSSRTRFALVLPVLAVLGATRFALACVVGTGTSASCTEAALDACLPGSGGFDGTVTFACGGNATIAATTSKTINAETTIDGGGGGGTITISGGGPAGLFFAIAPFTVKNLDIGGNGGDGAIVQPSSFPAPLTVTNSVLFNNVIAIDNFGTLTVSNSTFSQNTIVAITTNSATVMVDNVSFFQNGGGINSGGTVTVNNSTFGNNSGASGSGGNGAAINSSGSLTVANSTFDRNTATHNGGAISASGATTVSNSTFFGNTTGTTGAGGAIDVVGSGSLHVINCTLSGNGARAGAAIANNASGPVTVVNSVLAHPLISLNLPGGNCSGTITDDGHNIDDGTTCGFTGSGCATTNGTSFCSTNPQVGPLQNNGGPTQTIALASDSPAIDAGDETVCAAPPVNGLDQRGFARPGSGATNCSIGAYEFNATRCLLDVDRNGVGDVSTDVVYINRRLLMLTPVPPSFRAIDPSIPPDATIATNMDAIRSSLDVDANGNVDSATDIVYITRRLFHLTPVPPSFRLLDPTIPSDAVIAQRIDALCP